MPPKEILQDVRDARDYFERWMDDHEEAAAVVPSRGPGRDLYQHETQKIQLALAALNYADCLLDWKGDAGFKKVVAQLRKKLDKLESSLLRVKGD